MPSFTATGTGAVGTLQEWTVPIDGIYIIEAVGATGGGKYGGRGAVLLGHFSLTAGELLTICVGHKGHPIGLGNGDGDNNASGGGASFVRDSSGNPLIVAGGGAGCMLLDYPDSHGQAGAPAGLSSGGTSGYSTSGASWDTGGSGDAQPLNGSALGCTDNTYNEGGFGGGGSTNDGGSYSRAAGGGGYFGGTGAYASGDQSGGGGGSFNAGTNQENRAGSSGDPARDGFVSISTGRLVSGTIYDNTGTPVERVVRVYDRGTGELLVETLSDPVTGWYEAVMAGTEVQRVVLADEAVLTNDLIDRVIADPYTG